MRCVAVLILVCVVAGQTGSKCRCCCHFCQLVARRRSSGTFAVAPVGGDRTPGRQFNHELMTVLLRRGSTTWFASILHFARYGGSVFCGRNLEAEPSRVAMIHSWIRARSFLVAARHAGTSREPAVHETGIRRERATRGARRGSSIMLATALRRCAFSQVGDST